MTFQQLIKTKILQNADFFLIETYLKYSDVANIQLINVKMLTFISTINFMVSSIEYEIRLFKENLQ